MEVESLDGARLWKFSVLESLKQSRQNWRRLQDAAGERGIAQSQLKHAYDDLGSMLLNYINNLGNRKLGITVGMCSEIQ